MVVRSFDLGGKEGTRGFFVFFSSLSNFPPRHVLLPRCSFYEYGTCSGWLADTIILEQYTTRKCSRIARRLSWRGGSQGRNESFFFFNPGKRRCGKRGNLSICEFMFCD